MSARVFAVAALCLMAVSVVAAETIIQRVTYSEAGCTGTIQSVVNITATQCTPSSGGYQSTAYYTSANGDAVYLYTFSDRNCTTASAYAITSTATTCGGTFSNFGRYNVINPAAAPLSFPPAGWSTATQYFNLTSLKESTTCAAGAGIFTFQSASQIGGCRRVDAIVGQTQPAYTASFCLTGDSNSAGSAVFSDAGCTTTFRATVAPINVCKNGALTASCPSGAATFPSLPTTGYGKYSNEDCSGSVESVTYESSACYNSETFVCGTVNGTTMATVSTFTDSTRKGLCTGDATKTEYFLADATTCFKGKKYNCAYNPTPISAAAASSSSFVAMIAAAILAVFATRSL